MQFKPNLQKICVLLFLALLLASFNCQKLYIHSPAILANQFPNGIKIVISPLGFQPLSGQLDGVVALANPTSACSSIMNVENQVQDVFVFANDAECLQTIKAKNIAKAGGLVGIIKQNINNTLHDKQIGMVSIPIVELDPQIFDKIVSQINQSVGLQTISMSIQFGTPQLTHDINIELWMSPTQNSAYSFLINMQDFLKSQSNQVSFQPKYALHSQKDKKGYIGCLSSGRYCPVEIQYQGKMEGINIVEQSLRQLIIRDMGKQIWWKYIKNYYVQCLHNSRQDIMMSSNALSMCSQNSMILSGIDPTTVRTEFNNSFVGNRKEVDDNIYLRQQRQAYIKEQISSYPIILINKRSQSTFNQETIKAVVCRMENKKSQECLQMKDQGMQNTEILIAFAVVFAILVGTMIVYKIIMNRRMKREMKTEVQQTLDQYYRYMQTLEGDNGTSEKIQRPALKQNNESKKDRRQKQKAIQIQMSSNRNQGEHKTLVEQNE